MRKRTKQILALGLAAAMAFSMAACGSTSGDSSSSDAEKPADTASSDGSGDKAEEGKVLNIEVWNEEFKSRVTDHYPGYEKTDDTHGKIGDVTVNWIITPSDDNAYQNNLDKVLPTNADASADDKVDMFLVEADYAKKYISKDANVAMTMEDLGLTDFSKQYKYTQDIVSDEDGKMRASSWQACSAGLIYNRDAAKEVLGTDDPAAVQEAVKDWDAYNATAEKMAAAGYKMTATVNDTYRVYSNNVSKPWVEGGKLTLDDNIKRWVDDSMAQVKAGETTTEALWSDEWAKGFKPEGKVFCYFGPAWLISFSMHGDEEGSIAGNGGWGFVVGPQSYYWGGTWICAAQGTDNPTLVADIIKTMTTDDKVMQEIAEADSDCVNNKTVLDTLAKSDIAPVQPDFANKKPGNITYILGGQNPYATLAEGAEKVDMSNTTIYDQGCTEEFQSAMKNYFDGNASYDDALAQFKKAIGEKYSELTIE